jgi:hypothetical protein
MKQLIRLSGLLCIPLLVALVSLPTYHWETDFLSFYAGAKLAGTPQLYSVDAIHAIEAAYERETVQVRAYIRPAFYAVLLQPLSRLPFRTASVVWQILNVLAIGVFIWLWCRDQAALVVLFTPLWVCLMIGQDVPLFLAIIAASVWLLRKDRPLLAGIVLSLCAVKFHLFMLLPLLIVAKRLWRFAAGLTIGGIVLLCVSFLVNGNWVPGFLEIVRMNEIHEDHTNYMFNITGLVWGLPWHWLWFGLACAGVSIVLWKCIQQMDIAEALALTLVAGVLISMHVFMYDLGFLLPWVMLHERKRAMRLAVCLSIATVMVSMSIANAAAHYCLYLGPVILLGVVAEDVFRSRMKVQKAIGNAGIAEDGVLC